MRVMEFILFLSWYAISIAAASWAVYFLNYSVEIPASYSKLLVLGPSFVLNFLATRLISRATMRIYL